jgi:hypothetical protein
LGLKVFGPLRAEDEPWLVECFVPLTEFELMGEMKPRNTLGEPEPACPISVEEL